MEPTLIWILVSVLGGFVLALLLGRGLVPALRALKAGQSIREVGPKWHQGKAGTPTMGGIVFILSSLLCIVTGWYAMRETGDYKHLLVLALALMALNVLTSESVNGARNWLEVAGYSLQPSELVKVAYIYVGASTLDRLYRRRNLYSYIAFSAACVIALALIGDFGTALIFFATFLVISFMRSGSIATVILAVTGAGLAGFLAVSVKPYIAQRFANWGHVWEDIYNTGFQQTRAMSAAASGALFGKGAGSGWLHNVFAANTDMVFAMICEELGLIIALCSIAAILVLAFFAVRSASRSRSAFYSIAACATVSMPCAMKLPISAPNGKNPSYPAKAW